MSDQANFDTTDCMVTITIPGPSPTVDKPVRVYKQGQSTGSKLELTFDDLNLKERKVLRALSGHSRSDQALSIAGLGDALNWTKNYNKAKSSLMVRNSLRRLVRANLVGHAQSLRDGVYVITDAGQAMVPLAPNDTTAINREGEGDNASLEEVG